MKKPSMYLSLLMIALLIFFSINYYNSLSPSFISDDIEIVGSFETKDENDFLIVLDVKILGEGSGKHVIYPLVDGLGNISFIEDKGLYTPSSIGTWSEAEEKLKKVDNNVGMELLGFSIPAQPGNYKLQFTMSKLDSYQGIMDLKLYYVHVEDKLGKDLSWVKKVIIRGRIYGQ